MKYRNRTRGDASPPPQAPSQDPYGLPTDLAACLEAFSVVPRSYDEGPRVIVQFDGSGGWFHSYEETRKQLLHRWPSLTEGQLQRAVRHINARAMQAAGPAPAGYARRRWIHDY